MRIPVHGWIVAAFVLAIETPRSVAQQPSTSADTATVGFLLVRNDDMRGRPTGLAALTNTQRYRLQLEIKRNGRRVGSRIDMDEDECLLRELDPGDYVFHTHFKVINTEVRNSRQQVPVSVRSGEVLVLVAQTLEMGSSMAVTTDSFRLTGARRAKVVASYKKGGWTRQNSCLSHPELLAVRDAPDEPDAVSNAPERPPSTLEAQLAELKRLYDQGLITKEEYDAKRKELLDRME